MEKILIDKGAAHRGAAHKGAAARLVCKGAAAALALVCAQGAGAQGFVNDALTGSAVVYRDPARQASTETDAALNNPAGTAFLPQGLSFSAGVSCDFGVQKAVIPGNDLFDIRSNSYTMGPMLQMAWKRGGVTLSLSLGHTGGYGRRSLKGSPMLATGEYSGEYQTLNDELQRLNTEIAPYIFYFEDLNNNRVGLESIVNVASLYNWDARVGAAFNLGGNVALYAGLKASRVYNRQGSTVVAAVQSPDLGIYTSWDYYISSITYDIMSDNGDWVTEGHEPMDSEMKQYYVDRYLSLPAPEPQEKERISHSDNCLALAPVVGIDIKGETFNIGARFESPSVAHHGAYKVPALASAGLSVQASPMVTVAAGADVVFSQAYFYGEAKDRPVYNISASLSYRPYREWLLSGGLTYSRRNEWAPEAMPLPCPDPKDMVMLGAGCAYTVNKYVQFNFGVRTCLTQSKFTMGSPVSVDYTLRNPIQFAFGLNFHFGG